MTLRRAGVGGKHVVGAVAGGSIDVHGHFEPEFIGLLTVTTVGDGLGKEIAECGAELWQDDAVLWALWPSDTR